MVWREHQPQLSQCQEYALDDFAHAEMIANLRFTSDMQPSNLISRMLDLLPAIHKPCVFLQAAFLKPLVRAHLVHDRTLDPLTLALHADEILQSHASSSSVLNHVSSALVLGEEFPVHSVLPSSSFSYSLFFFSWSQFLPCS